MKIYKYCILCCVIISAYSCRTTSKTVVHNSSVIKSQGNKPGVPLKSQIVLKNQVASRSINTKNVTAENVVKFAETLQGIPYAWGSMVKEKGFDCSGFINYVFNNFKISVPRVSKDFTNAGASISSLECKRGDLILFTGSDPASGEVGHMGMITRNDNGVLQFIHAASGKGGGVMISTVNSYFYPRFVKIIRVFNNI